jgi:hypothetical protein
MGLAIAEAAAVRLALERHWDYLCAKARRIRLFEEINQPDKAHSRGMPKAGRH